MLFITYRHLLLCSTEMCLHMCLNFIQWIMNIAMFASDSDELGIV